MKPFTKQLDIELNWHGRTMVLEFVRVGNKTMVLSPRRIKTLGIKKAKPMIEIIDGETFYTPHNSEYRQPTYL